MMASTDFLPVKETIEVLAFFEINPPGSDLPTGLDYLFISKDSEAVEGGNNLYLFHYFIISRFTETFETLVVRDFITRFSRHSMARFSGALI